MKYLKIVGYQMFNIIGLQKCFIKVRTSTVLETLFPIISALKTAI